MTPVHPFHFLAQCFRYPHRDSYRDRGRTLALLANDYHLDVNSTQLTEVALTEQQAEYVRLFINGPGGVAAPPYASVYINNTGMLRQQGYDQALALYRQAGLMPVDVPEPADHIAHELTFIGLLIDREDEQILRSFVESHLNLWLPSFLQRIFQANPFVFYKILAMVTDLCLQQLSKEVLHEQTTFP